MDLDEYDSDDEDVAPFHTISDTIGLQSVHQIEQFAAQLRKDSNRFTRSITNVIRAHPRTQYLYDLVWTRFSVFYTTTLRQEYVSTPNPSATSAILTLPSIRNCPTPIHVQRFISILPSQLKARNQTGLLALSTLESQFTILSVCLHFHYANWSFTAHDEQRMASTLQVLLAKKMITDTAGTRMSPYDLDALEVSYMIQRMFQYAEFYGSKNWTITVQRILAITLQSAVASRSGDIMQSRGVAETKVLLFKHISLRLSGGQTIENIYLEVTIANQKFHK
jgi:hypothetical protein